MSAQNESQDTNRNTGSIFIAPFTFILRPGANNNDQQSDDQQSQTQQEQTDTSQEQSSNFPQPTIFEVQIPNLQNVQASTTSPTQESDDNEQPQQQQFIQFIFYPVPGLNGGEPPAFFFTPLFMAPQEQRKPRASETAMKNLHIVKIVQEHIDAKATCPICLDAFTITPSSQDDTGARPVREMPCKHVFCESCLFEWLRMNNTCPLCRMEIEAETPQEQEKQQDQQAGEAVRENATSSSPSASSNNTRRGAGVRNARHTHRHPYRRHVVQTTSCALDRVGCCGESNSHSSGTSAPSTQQCTPIITLPQCHHRFHASCLRTSLLVEGYSLEASSSPLNFHCPTCRAPAMLQSDALKLPIISTSTDNNNVLPSEESSGLQLPLTIRLPDEMDLD